MSSTLSGVSSGTWKNSSCWNSTNRKNITVSAHELDLFKQVAQVAQSNGESFLVSDILIPVVSPFKTNKARSKTNVKRGPDQNVVEIEYDATLLEAFLR